MHGAIAEAGIQMFDFLYFSEAVMAVAKVIEIISGSKNSFEDAIKQGIARAAETLNGIASAWVKEQSVVVEGGKVAEYRVTLSVTFMLDAPGKPAGKKKK